MIIDFSHEDSAGQINITCKPNTMPVRMGCRSDAFELPYCKATLSASAQGYKSMMGWVQLVRSGDNRSSGKKFEMDPFSLFEDADSPYAFYGHLPTLFDAPARDHRADMDWLAHSFLAGTPLGKGQMIVQHIAGFSWGFAFKDGQIISKPVTVLSPEDWNSHIAFLSSAYPNWSSNEMA